MGTRERAAGLDFSGVLEEETEAALKEAAQISMGTEISGEDLENIQALSDQVRGVQGGSANLASAPLLAARCPRAVVNRPPPKQQAPPLAFMFSRWTALPPLSPPGRGAV